MFVMSNALTVTVQLLLYAHTFQVRLIFTNVSCFVIGVLDQRQMLELKKMHLLHFRQ